MNATWHRSSSRGPRTRTPTYAKRCATRPWRPLNGCTGVRTSSRSRSPSPMTRRPWRAATSDGERPAERRRRDNTVEAMRAQARDAIRRRKGEEERQAWLRRLRDEASRCVVTNGDLLPPTLQRDLLEGEFTGVELKGICGRADAQGDHDRTAVIWSAWIQVQSHGLGNRDRLVPQPHSGCMGTARRKVRQDDRRYEGKEKQPTHGTSVGRKACGGNYITAVVESVGEIACGPAELWHIEPVIALVDLAWAQAVLEPPELKERAEVERLAIAPEPHAAAKRAVEEGQPGGGIEPDQKELSRLIGGEGEAQALIGEPAREVAGAEDLEGRGLGRRARRLGLRVGDWLHGCAGVWRERIPYRTDRNARPRARGAYRTAVSTNRTGNGVSQHGMGVKEHPIFTLCGH